MTNTGRAHPSDRATRPTDQAPAGLGDTASVPCAFTPGPWEIRRQGNVIAQADGGPVVCDLNGVLGHDANLIAAAPDLYAALGKLMGTSELNDENREAMAEAAAVRRRVRGEQVPA